MIHPYMDVTKHLKKDFLLFRGQESYMALMIIYLYGVGKNSFFNRDVFNFG